MTWTIRYQSPIDKGYCTNENCSGRQPRVFQTNTGSVSSSDSTKEQANKQSTKLFISKFLIKKDSWSIASHNPPPQHSEDATYNCERSFPQDINTHLIATHKHQILVTFRASNTQIEYFKLSACRRQKSVFLVWQCNTPFVPKGQQRNEHIHGPAKTRAGRLQDWHKSTQPRHHREESTGSSRPALPSLPSSSSSISQHRTLT